MIPPTSVSNTPWSNAVSGTSLNWEGKIQTWRFVVHEDGRHFIEMHQPGKNTFTLRLDTDQVAAIRDMLNNTEHLGVKA